jgi:hypothetical protein
MYSVLFTRFSRLYIIFNLGIIGMLIDYPTTCYDRLLTSF